MTVNLTLRNVKGSALTHSEVDGNFLSVKQELDELSSDSGSTLVGGVPAKNLARRYKESVVITDFGGICNGGLNKASSQFSTLGQCQAVYPSATSLDDYIDTLAMEKALAFIGDYGSIELVGTPRFSRKVSLPLTSRGICIFAKNPITVVFDVTGDGFFIKNLNENFGGNILKNLNIIGPDILYPPVSWLPSNTGGGVTTEYSWDNIFENVNVAGFGYGFHLKVRGYNNKAIGNCSAVGNGIGVFIDSGSGLDGDLNLNDFSKIKIRLNRKVGVVIDCAASTNKATGNKFKGAYIESNIPYLGQYLPPPNDGSHSVGVILQNTYSNDFSDVYYENHDYDIILANQSSFNKFCNDRHAPGGASFSRKGRIWLQGQDINENDFTGSEFVAWDSVTASVISTEINQRNNKFINTVGHNFIPAQMACFANSIIRNNTKHTRVNGTTVSAIGRDPDGVYINPSEGTAASLTPSIQGIGTSAAVLYAKYLGEIVLGSEITAPTSIVAIEQVRYGQIFTLINYQIGHPVTIKASGRVNFLILNNNVDCVLDNYGDTILFYVNSLGQCVEIGRNIG